MLVGAVAGIIATILSGVFVYRPFLEEQQWKKTEECYVEDIQLSAGPDSEDGIYLSDLIKISEKTDFWEMFGMGPDKSIEDWSRETSSEEWSREENHDRSSSSEEHHRGKRAMSHEDFGDLDGDWSTEENCPKPVWNAMEGMGESLMSRGLMIGGEPCVRVLVSYTHDDQSWHDGLLHKNMKHHHEEEMCTFVPDMRKPGKAVMKIVKTVGPYIKAMVSSEKMTCFAKKYHDELYWDDEMDGILEDETEERERDEPPRRDDSLERPQGHRDDYKRKRRSVDDIDLENSVMKERTMHACSSRAAVIVPAVVASVCLVALILRRICRRPQPKRDQIEEKYQPDHAPAHVRNASVCVVNPPKVAEAWAEKVPLPSDQAVVPSYDDAMKTAPPCYLFVAQQGEEEKVDLSKTEEKEDLAKTEPADVTKY